MNIKGVLTITSTARLSNLRRSDLGTLVGCTANNTDLVQEPPQSVFSVNMLRESLHFAARLSQVSSL